MIWGSDRKPELTNETNALAEVCAPLDDGMNFLTAVDLSSEQYKVVCNVIERAYFRSKIQWASGVLRGMVELDSRGDGT